MGNFEKRILTKLALGVTFMMGGAAFQLYDSHVWVSRGIMVAFLIGMQVIVHTAYKGD